MILEPYPKPTRLLGRVENFHQIIYKGDPEFDGNGRYVGPLTKRTSSNPMVLGRLPDGTFRSESSAAWPPQLCDEIATRIIAGFLRSNGNQLKKGSGAKDEKGEVEWA